MKCLVEKLFLSCKWLLLGGILFSTGSACSVERLEEQKATQTPTDQGKASTTADEGKTAQLSASASQFAMTVTGFKSRQGNLCLSLFDQDKGFPDKREFAKFFHCYSVSEILIATEGQDQFSVRVYLEALSDSTSYALSVFHDENGNNDLDMKSIKLMGLSIPEEPYGFSTNPGLTIGAPNFDKVSFKPADFKDGLTVSLIRL